ncbi:UNVERIFIED_CONTAM: hypothetical protein LK11_22720 [Mumia flava]
MLVPDGDKPTDGVPVSFGIGLVGVTGDPVGGYTLVVDETADRGALLRALTRGLDRSARSYVDFADAPHPAAELTEAWRAVRDPAVRAAAGLGAFTVDVDPESATLVVTTAGDAALRTGGADALADALGAVAPGLITVESGGAGGRASRSPDVAPHWGGARIVSSGTRCTAGFSVVRRSGGRASLTAGHCGPNGTSWKSGTEFYGVTRGRSGFPDYDQARLQGSTYAPRIYTDGLDRYSSRAVHNANDGAIGDVVCASGDVTLSVCGIVIKSFTATFCDDVGCTTHLMRGRRSDDRVIVRDGDSGAPVYHRNPSKPRASVRGMVIAYDQGGSRLYAERYTSIANHLDVTALTN